MIQIKVLRNRLKRAAKSLRKARKASALKRWGRGYLRADLEQKRRRQDLQYIEAICKAYASGNQRLENIVRRLMEFGVAAETAKKFVRAAA